MSKGLNSFIAVIQREVTRIFKDRVILFVSFIAPAFGMLMIWWIFSAGVIRDVPVAVVNYDQSEVSRQIAHMLDASAVIKIVDECPELLAAQELMERGKVNGIVVLPKDLEKELIRGLSPSIVVYINNINVVAGGILKSNIQTTLSTFSTGAKMQVQMKKGFTQQQAIERVMPIRLDTHILFNPYTNYSYFLALGLIPLIVVVVCFLGTLYAVGSEIKDGSAPELMHTANDNIFIAIIGKVLPHTLIYLFNILLSSLLLIHFIGLPMHGNIWILLLSDVVLILAYQSISLIFIALTSNLRLSLSLGSAYTMMALTFSGLTFPAFAMPKIAELFSYLFPYTYWLQIFMNETLRSIPNLQLGQAFLALLAFIFLSLFAFNKLEHIFTDKKYWGKS